MNALTLCLFLFHLQKFATSDHSRHAFDDSILYNINWPGKNFQLIEESEVAKTMVVTTHEKETYKCVLPVIKDTKKDSEEEYNGPNPIDLLIKLFLFSPCTTLLESYWTYELCHGKHIRQYHEEREGKKVKIQEYYLGKWDMSMTDKLSLEFTKEFVYKEKVEGKKFIPPMKKLDGITLPYLQFNFTEGTICDLNGKPRRTNVLYVCFPNGKNDIFSIKETSTCEYEVIVISPELCRHPKYRPQVNVEHDINCLPVGESPTKPKSLSEMEAEIFKQSFFPAAFDDAKNGHTFAVYSIDEFKDKDGKMQVRVELRPVTPEKTSDLSNKIDASDTLIAPGSTASISEEHQGSASIVLEGEDSKETDLTMFLSGKLCLQGGFGWWKYYFCYGAPIEQFHSSSGEDGERDKASIILGVWDEEVHKQWLKKKPSKRPKPLGKRTYITHFYGNGDICAETGKPRETEVRLQCTPKTELDETHLGLIYHLEPQVCQYILIFESDLICQLLPKVDEDGLIDIKTLLK
ncbi:endoplasmic reticulum lectin 1 [Cimex lectularius]|uniref:Endoplasmic reticulum lectin 1 n=1 Tax=Cimex lectularius TaxID=79782 RepID=A0A8I6S675_CIMLE|nr:endoplasmic reticulum lectin 1 [Cimex lectularius]